MHSSIKVVGNMFWNCSPTKGMGSITFNILLKASPSMLNNLQKFKQRGAASLVNMLAEKRSEKESVS